MSQLFRQPEYIHVLINPLPIYGLGLALLGLTMSILQRNRKAQVVALTLVLISAASAWPVYEFGEQGYDRVLSMSDDAGRAWLDQHQHRADQLIWFFYALAAISAAAIFAPMRWPRSTTTLAVITLLLGAAVLGMGGYIGYAGGKIRHREFRTGPATAGTY